MEKKGREGEKDIGEGKEETKALGKKGMECIKSLDNKGGRQRVWGRKEKE